MKQSISVPVAVGILVVVVVLFVAIGWRYMSAGPRDKFGHDLSVPGVQPSNMGEEMRNRMNAARAGGQAAGRWMPL